jgi:hypothetical protein
MFTVLAGFCYVFYRRACSKGYMQANLRAVIYVICGVAIIIAILAIAIDKLSGGAISTAMTETGLNGARLTFYGEHVGLVAFGVSWLTASRVLPVITRKDERFSPLGDSKPAA